MSVEVAGGPTVGLKSTVKLPRCVRDTSKNGDESDLKRSNRSGFFLEEIKEEEEEEEGERRSETSSIGLCSSADEKEEEEEEEEVQSKESVEEKKSSLSSLDSLEDSLPIKRGLSNFYSGKSKSFTSLSNAGNATARDLRKPENPFNKRRRVQQMAAWSRRASCSSLLLSSMAGSSPTLSEYEKEVEEEEEEEMPLMRGGGKGKRPSLFTCTPLQIWGGDNEKKMPLKSPSPRSFSLSDLTKHAQQHLD